MKIKFNSFKIESIGGGYSNLTLFLNGSVTYKVTMPDSEAEEFESSRKSK